MILIDTHAHMYADAFDDDLQECMQRAASAGINLVALPNIDTRSIEPLRRVRKEFPDNTIGMMGLHPGSVKADYENELQIIKEELDRGGYHAVGEIGIDLYWDKTFQAEQVIAFETQIGWAKEKGLPIAIHARDAFDEICEVLDRLCDERLTGVFHCFTGTPAQAQKALTYPGFYLGIGGVATFKNGGLDKVIPEIDPERLVLETDSPYLAPAPFRGKRNETAYTSLVANRVADILGMPVEAIATQTTANAKKLFKLND